MNDYKHICDFSYCKIHQVCLYKNASSVLKHGPCEAKVGHDENANTIVCYQLGLDTDVYEGEHKKLPHCERQKCYKVADTRFNGEMNLCFKCVDLLREYKTNYELGTIFRKKDKLIKLFKVIEELKSEKEMVRCSNIYCGTLYNMTRHHLIPKAFRNKLPVPKIPLCEDCHKKVHKLATNQELAQTYNTKQAVQELLATDVPFRIERMINVYQNERLIAVA